MCYTWSYIPLHRYPWCPGLEPRPLLYLVPTKYIFQPCSLAHSSEIILFEGHILYFSFSVLTILLGDSWWRKLTLVKWPGRACFATHPWNETGWPPKLLTRFSSWTWNYTVICRRANKCEPLLRFSPLNLAKIACFAKWVYEAKSVPSPSIEKSVDDSNLQYFECKSSNKMTNILEALGCAL